MVTHVELREQADRMHRVLTDGTLRLETVRSRLDMHVIPDIGTQMILSDLCSVLELIWAEFQSDWRPRIEQLRDVADRVERILGAADDK